MLMNFIGSVTLVGSPCGFIASGFIIDRFGRKPSLLWSTVPSIIGWFLLTKEFSPVRTYIGRILTGFTSGATAYSASVYLEECLIRDRINFKCSFTTWSATASAFGVCLVYILGSLMNYHEVASFVLVISICFFILIFVFVPESPVWLYKQGRFGDAELNQKYLRVRLQYQDFVEAETLLQSHPTNSLPKWKDLVNILQHRNIYKPIIITTVLLSFAMLSGGLILSTYMIDTIRTKTLSFKYSYPLAIIAGILQFFISASITFILPWSGNRRLTFISGIGLTFGMSLIALTSLLNHSDYQKLIDMIHIIAVWLSISMFSLGYLTLPNALLGQIFPPDVRGLASIPVMISFVINYIIIQMHLHLYMRYGGIVYIFYAVMDVAGTYFVWVLMPETEGKSFQNIQDEF